MTSVEDVIGQPAKVQLETFLDEHRAALHASLDDLSEEQVRRSQVPSRTTLLGLVKHATFVERVWFDEAVTCRSRREIGIPATPDESFVLEPEDTITSVLEAHTSACEDSRRATASMDLDDELLGNRRGPVPLRWVYFHMLRELAQHCGHADILPRAAAERLSAGSQTSTVSCTVTVSPRSRRSAFRTAALSGTT